MGLCWDYRAREGNSPLKGLVGVIIHLSIPDLRDDERVLHKQSAEYAV